jgi:microsomal dipeptidase-like Zn-dependent dipeptidase
MASNARKYFIRQLSLLVMGIALKPPFLSGKELSAVQASGSPVADPAPRVVDLSEGIIDLHCHPSLKMYLLNKHFWKKHHPVPGPNMIHMQVDLDQLRFGFVKGMVATHYLVEAAAEREWDLLKKLWPALMRFLHRFTDKFEHEDETNIDQIKCMIKLFNEQMAYTNSIQTDITFVIARSYEEFEAALSAGQLPIAHAIEGAHALGRNLPVSEKRERYVEKQIQEATIKQPGYVAHREKMSAGRGLTNAAAYLRNLEDLHQQGVCMMALSHFFRNDIAYPVDGISPDSKKLPGMAWQYTPDKDHGLTTVGREVVHRMLEIGMIVDLTHSTPMIRKEVFEMTQVFNTRRVRQNKPKRPVIFSHAGAQQIFEYYDQQHYPYYKFYNVSDEEIAALCESDGVIGVLAENFWLVGADTHLKKEFPPYQFRYGIPYIIQTMKYINSKSKDKEFDNVAIGTDFDGLADAPKDLFAPSQLGNLIRVMKDDPDFKPEHITKILSGNARRVLKCGWGG